MKFLVFTKRLLRMAMCICLALAFLHSKDCSAQLGEATAISRAENASMMRQTISRPITQLKVLRNSAVNLVYDTANYIDVWYNPKQGNPLNDNFIAIKGMTLYIDDPEGDAVYFVHLKRKELQFVSRDATAVLVYVADTTSVDADSIKYDFKSRKSTNTSNLALRETLEEARRDLIAAKEELRKSLGSLADTLAVYGFDFDTVSDDYEFEEFNTYTEELDETEDEEAESDVFAKNDFIKYDWSERIEGGLLWGFCNWGSEWYNGLSSLDGVSNLKTSFSSWQLELQYAVLMTRHLNLSLGVGYESDIYRFSTPLVSVNANGRFQDVTTTLPYQNYNDFLQDNQLFSTTQLNDWSSSVVTRYIGVPITLGLRFDDFRVSLTALPALTINTRHTGLKHRLNGDNISYSDQTDLTGLLLPYKLDLRVELRYSLFGIFAQIATTSLFKENVGEVFPIKMGFEVKFSDR